MLQEKCVFNLKKKNKKQTGGGGSNISFIPAESGAYGFKQRSE